MVEKNKKQTPVSPVSPVNPARSFTGQASPFTVNPSGQVLQDKSVQDESVHGQSVYGESVHGESVRISSYLMLREWSPDPPQDAGGNSRSLRVSAFLPPLGRTIRFTPLAGSAYGMTSPAEPLRPKNLPISLTILY